MNGTLLLFVAALTVGATEDAGKQSIIRLDPDGPTGVGMKGDDEKKAHVYYKSTDSEGISAGVWEAAPSTSGPHAATYTEFMYILKGSVTLIDKNDGREETFTAGDALLVPRGTDYTWKQTERLRKYWVIFDREAEAEKPASPKTTFIRFDPDGPDGKGLTGEGRTKEHTYYAARDGKVSAGVWETAPHTSSKFHTTKYAELMCFLEGSVTLIDGDGNEEHFEAGGFALVPKGIDYKWKGDYVKKYWVIFDAE